MHWLISFILIAIISFFQNNFMEARNKMVEEQIIARGITNPSVIEAMRNVPRHKFVPANYIAYAYGDHPLEIGYNQTISQPYIVAYMTAALNLKKSDKVLEIGTGSGYQAAILAEIVSEVISIEIVEPLGIESKERLEKLNYSNVTVIAGDGYIGYSKEAPYNAIIVTAAPEKIPPALIDQLEEGGRMIIPVGPEKSTQYLKLIQKKKGKCRETSLLPVRFVPFTGDSQ